MIPTDNFFDEIFDCLALHILDDLCIGKSNIYYGKLKKTYNDFIYHIKQFVFSNEMLGSDYADYFGLSYKGMLDLTILYKLVLNKLITIEEIEKIYDKNKKLDFFNENIKESLIIVTEIFGKYKNDYIAMYEHLKNNTCGSMILYLNLNNKIRDRKFMEKNRDKIDELFNIYEILFRNFKIIL